MSAPRPIVYVTSSPFKIEEANVLSDCLLPDGRRIGDLFTFQIRQVAITETLEVELDAMVRAEVRAAYAKTKVPCIVEHAGLIFDGRTNYPGGLTKAMWKALGDDFVSETHMEGKGARARAVVGYCDGLKIHLFTGETEGVLVDPPRGARKFYWDRIFVPTGSPNGKTYAEIVEDANLGLKHKMEKYSQSAKAMREFLAHLEAHGLPPFWQ